MNKHEQISKRLVAEMQQAQLHRLMLRGGIDYVHPCFARMLVDDIRERMERVGLLSHALNRLTLEGM